MLSSYVKRNSSGANSIVINNAVIGHLVMMYRLQNNGFPEEGQLNAMIGQYIDDEIMYREAEKMGLEKEDEIVRRRLIQKYRFINRDLSVLKTPSENELVDYYKQNARLFQDSATVSFTHIYFSRDVIGDETARAKALEVLSRLTKKTVPHRAPELGDPFGLQYDYTDADKSQVTQQFGASEMTDALFQQKMGQWFGPVRSGYGWHLVLITDSKTARAQHYADIKDKVRQCYEDYLSETSNARRFEVVKRRYIIQRDYLKQAKE